MGLRARKYSVAFAALAALTLAGCPKNESPEDVELAAQQARKAAQSKKKVDVFDEFYMDDAKKSPDSAKSKGKGKGKAEASVAEPKALAAPDGSQGFSKSGRYVVQLNSTASESGATKMANKLKGMGYPAYVAAVQNPTPELTGTYFRVRIGAFDSYSEAKAFAEGTLAAAGYDYWIDRKANDNVGIQGSGFGSAGGQQQYPAAPPQQYPPAPAQQAAPPQQYRPAAPPQQYPPAPAQQAAPPPQQYRPAAPPQQYPPAPSQQAAPPPQQYRPAVPPQQYPPAPAQQAAPPPQQYRPAAPPQQYPPAPSQQAAPPPVQGAQPAVRPQQPAPAQTPASQPAAKPQQPAPAQTPASQPAAKPQQPAPAQAPAAKPADNGWGASDDWGAGDW